MGFSLVTGKMGGGKSYYGMEQCLQCWAENGIVHTNLDLIIEKVSTLGLDPEQLVQLDDDPKDWIKSLQPGEEGRENLVVVDEGALIFNAKDWNKEVAMKQEVFNFMIYSRKLGLDVLFITQSAKNVDAQIRRVAENVVQCVKTTSLVPGIGHFIAKIKGEFRRYVTDITGRTVLESLWARCNPEVYQYYRTAAMHGKFAGLERNVRRTAKVDQSVVRSKRKLIGFACLLLTLILGAGFGLVRTFARLVGDSKVPMPAAKPVVPGPVKMVETPPLPPAVAPPAVAKVLQYLPRTGAGIDSHGAHYVDVLGEGEARLGRVWRDQMVMRIERHGAIRIIVLEDGTQVKTRPSTRADVRTYLEAEKAKETPSWSPKSLLSPSPSGPVSLPDSLPQFLSGQRAQSSKP